MLDAPEATGCDGAQGGAFRVDSLGTRVGVEVHGAGAERAEEAGEKIGALECHGCEEDGEREKEKGGRVARQCGRCGGVGLI